MKKAVPRSAKDQHLLMQANLKEMNTEVSQYLTKNNSGTIPPILRPRNYLIVSYLQNLNSRQGAEEKEQMRTDLSSEILGSARDSDKFQSLRQANSKESLNSAKSKHKKGYSSYNPENQHLFPNINQLKLDFQDKNIGNYSSRKNMREAKSLRIQKKDSFMRVRKYLNIDLLSKSKAKQTPQEGSKNMDSRLFCVGMQLMDKLHKQYEDNKRYDLMLSQQDRPQQRCLGDSLQLKVKRALVNEKLLSIQRKQQIIKRRKAANNQQIQLQSIPYKHKQLRTPKKEGKKQELYCPWQQQKALQEQTLF